MSPLPARQTTHGGATIKSQLRAGRWRAVAERNGVWVTAPHEGASEEQAVNAVKAELDAARSRVVAARGPGGYPGAAEVRAALKVVLGAGRGKPRLSASQLRMLDAHRSAPDAIMTATELAAVAKYRNYAAANLHYGLAGRLLAEEMDWTPAERNDAGEPIWTFALATGGRAPGLEVGDPHWRWEMRPAVAQALADALAPAR